MRLILLTLCVGTLEQAFGSPISSTGPVNPDKGNMTANSVQNVPPPKEEKEEKPKFDPKDNLSMDKINFIMYAGRVISTLNNDPKYAEMKERLKGPMVEDRNFLNLMAMMSEKTTTKLNKIKAEEYEKLKQLKKNKCPKVETEPEPSYLDMHNPDKFNWIDLHLVIAKVTTMRSVLEKFIHGTR